MILFSSCVSFTLMFKKFKVFGRSQLLLATGTCTPLSIANRRNVETHCNASLHPRAY